MAGFEAIAAAGKSIERLLNAGFKSQQPIDNTHKARAVLVRTDDLSPKHAAKAIGSPAVSIFLYRTDFNKTMRAAWSAVGSFDGRAHLALDLHYLVTAWADNAEHEHLLLGRTLEILETFPIMGGPLLAETAQWQPNEQLQLVLEDISTEALMRIFDSLPADYRLSVPYIARVIRVESKVANPAVPVTEAISGMTPSAIR